MEKFEFFTSSKFHAKKIKNKECFSRNQLLNFLEDAQCGALANLKSGTTAVMIERNETKQYPRLRENTMLREMNKRGFKPKIYHTYPKYGSFEYQKWNHIKWIEGRPRTKWIRFWWSSRINKNEDSDYDEDNDEDSDYEEDNDEDSDYDKDNDEDSDYDKDNDEDSDYDKDNDEDSDYEEDNDEGSDYEGSDYVENVVEDRDHVEDNEEDSDYVEDNEEDSDYVEDNDEVSDYVEDNDADSDYVEDNDEDSDY
jgi:hypothetical protein